MTEAENIGAGTRFEDLKVLIVEDETIVSFLIEDMLKDLGCAIVWHAAGSEDALALLSRHRPDLAVLDVNLSGKSVHPVATRLEMTGIPFLFATGYGRSGIPERWAGRPVIQKPFTRDALAVAVKQLLAG